MDNVPEQVDQVLGVLAERFGSTGAHLWEVLIRQAYINAGGWIVCAIAGALVTRWIWSHRNHVLQTSGRYDAEGWTVASAVAALISAGFVFAAVNATSYALNPEYFALQKILGAF